MPGMPKLWTSNELYPPDVPAELRKLLDQVLTAQRDAGGRTLLRRALTNDERKRLHDREKEMLRWLDKPRFGDLQPIFLALFQGFGGRSESEEEAAIKAMQYAYALGSWPAWAVKRACDRFANASVTPEEIGAKKIDRSFSPSSAQIAMVVRALVAPFGLENVRIRAALAGVAPARLLTDEEHAQSAQRIEGMLADVQRHMAVTHLEDAQRDARRHEERAETTRKQDLELRRAEYLAAGLEPPVVKNGMVTSLPMMLRMGWHIEDVRGRNVLVAPPKEPTRSSETQLNEMGS